jgi:hypothetical protein
MYIFLKKCSFILNKKKCMFSQVCPKASDPFLKVQSQKIIIDAVRAKTVDDTTTTENQQEGKYSYFHSGSV